MKVLFISKNTGKECFAKVRYIRGRLFIDRPTFLRLLRRLGCSSSDDIFCSDIVFYSFPTLGRVHRDYKCFSLLSEV